jgi:putative transferase (TIGR04331 family)
MRSGNIFVALTANEKFWDKSKDILLLGDWCLSDIEKKCEYKILSHPIKFKRSSYSEFDQYNQELYSKYLIIFTGLLNKEHKTNYSVRYWDILFGSFLYRYIGIMYERYLTIQHLLKKYGQFDCLIADTSKGGAIIVDELSFMGLVQDDDYNFELYSKILSFLNVDARKIKIDSKQIDIDPHKHQSNKYLKKIIEFIFWLISFLKNNKKTIFMKNPYLDIKFITKLALFSKHGIKVKFHEGYDSNHNYNIETRRRFQECLPGGNEFELFLKTELPFDLPMSLVENYTYLGKLAKKQYPKQFPDIIFSANSWYYDSLFKIWAASALGKSKLLGIQHGGNYGVSRYLLEEKYERKITDFYLTWGWGKHKCNNVIPFGSAKMINYKKRRSNSDDILFVMTNKPKYFCDLRFVPRERVSYFENQKTFLDNISDNLLDKFRIRPYPSKDRHRYINLWRTYNKEIKVDDENEKFIDSLNNCKLYVSDHLMTTYLESLKMNIPTIFFLNKKYPNGLINKNAIKDFQKLEDVGILYYSAESAALAINRMDDNIDEWWFTPEVQSVREEFCYKFAKNLNNPICEFNNLFTKVSGNRSNTSIC